MFDPEPDRDEAAQRPSPGRNVLATTLPLIEALDDAARPASAASTAPQTTAVDRPMGLRMHFKLAAASCDGRATFFSGGGKADEAALFTALADLFYEVSEQDEHTGPVAGRLLAVADLLVGYGGDDTSPQPPAPQGGDAR